MYAERKLTETYRRDGEAYITCLERHTASLPLTQCAMSLEIEHEDVLRFIKIYNVFITARQEDNPLVRQLVAWAQRTGRL